MFCSQVLHAREGLIESFQEAVAGKDEAELARLLHEDPDVTKRRAECARRLKLLEKAQSEIANARF